MVSYIDSWCLVETYVLLPHLYMDPLFGLCGPEYDHCNSYTGCTPSSAWPLPNSNGHSSVAFIVVTY